MKGRVDESRRALITLQVSSQPHDAESAVTAWIDTAFDGFFVFPRDIIKSLGLEQKAITQAILADGSRVLLKSYVCYLHWFGEYVAAQVIANDGKLPLLGTEFLAQRLLVVDYAKGVVSVE